MNIKIMTYIIGLLKKRYYLYIPYYFIVISMAQIFIRPDSRISPEVIWDSAKIIAYMNMGIDYSNMKILSLENSLIAASNIPKFFTKEE